MQGAPRGVLPCPHSPPCHLLKEDAGILSWGFFLATNKGLCSAGAEPPEHCQVMTEAGGEEGRRWVNIQLPCPGWNILGRLSSLPAIPGACHRQQQVSC